MLENLLSAQTASPLFPPYATGITTIPQSRKLGIF